MGLRRFSSWKILFFVTFFVFGGFYFIFRSPLKLVDETLALRPAEAVRGKFNHESKNHLRDAESCQHSSEAFRCVRFLSNYDGDTIQVQIPDVHPLIGEKISVRVLGVDTPEKTGTKPCEKQKAREAQRLVESLLRRAQRIDLLNLDRDKYFRILARVHFDGQDLSEILLGNALAIPYGGGRKPASMDWCRLQKN
ncbi:MAG: thermonuclease family protein [Bdellovibrio sp.]